MALVLTRLSKELKELNYDNPEMGISGGYINEDTLHWNVWFIGPTGTPFEGGVFRVKIDFKEGYPFKPPEVKFITKVFHPNIASNGSICLDILKEKWSPVLTVSRMIISLISLLSDPNPMSPLDPDAASLYRKNRKEYDDKVKEYTKKYAIPTFD